MKRRLEVSASAVEVISTLQNAGFESYVVGGAVRDLLLGRSPKDFDISTAASPEEVRAVFGRHRARIIGKRFRLAHVYVGRELFEVSTFRRAPETNGADERGIKDPQKMPEHLIFSDNSFGTAHEDAWRRDFTVNALFYDPLKEEILDYTGQGIADIQAHVVRAIGTPALRFEEDPVRILRALKLVAQFDFALDAATGRVLFADGADAKAYPASVTKLMTAYLVLEDVRAGRLSLSEPVVASPVKSRADAHFRQASCLGLRAGESMDADTMLKAMLVHSANDAAVFLAERCSGSVEAFVARMNAKAAELGMAATRYYNPNGLPPPPNAKERNFNFSTCEDQARLALVILRDCPEMLRYTSLKTCDVTFPNGRSQRFVNHNNVMVKNKLKVVNPDGTEAVDGLKTGYIDAGGSSVVLTGTRGGRRVVVVVLGSTSGAERDEVASLRIRDALDAVQQ